MITIILIISGIMYIISASLPFWSNKITHIVIASIIGLLSSLSWVYISRTISKQDLLYYGLVYDTIITLAFLMTPFIFMKFSLSNTQIFGIILTLIGLYLTK